MALRKLVVVTSGAALQLANVQRLAREMVEQVTSERPRSLRLSYSRKINGNFLPDHASVFIRYLFPRIFTFERDTSVALNELRRSCLDNSEEPGSRSDVRYNYREGIVSAEFVFTE